MIFERIVIEDASHNASEISLEIFFLFDAPFQTTS